MWTSLHFHFNFELRVFDFPNRLYILHLFLARRVTPNERFFCSQMLCSSSRNKWNFCPIFSLCFPLSKSRKRAKFRRTRLVVSTSVPLAFEVETLAKRKMRKRIDVDVIWLVSYSQRDGSQWSNLHPKVISILNRIKKADLKSKQLIFWSNTTSLSRASNHTTC